MKKLLNHLVIGALGLFCSVYLFNPGWGVVELIPDNFPVIGNLDEAAAAALLISCLAYFGLDVTRLFRKAGEHDSRRGRGKEVVIDLEESRETRG